MGKIRVKTLGDEEQEKKSREARSRSAKQKELRKQAEIAEESVIVSDNEGSRDSSSSTFSEASVDKSVQNDKNGKISASPEAPKQPAKKQKSSAAKARIRSAKYKEVAIIVDKTKTYKLKEALEVLPKLQRSKFDETVELHINTTGTGISGNVTLPHGTGKKMRVAIADDALIAQVEKGTIDFDILIAEPTMMPKLARVAKFLGPKGLMPNPKNGTISPNPKEVAKKYEGGAINFKTEAKFPILHLTVGKVSFGEEKLSENLKALVKAVKTTNIKNATLKSTMSPGIKIDIASLQ